MQDQKPADPMKEIPVSAQQMTALKNCIIEKTKTLGDKGRRNKTGAIIVYILIISFSAATTILIGWKAGVTDNLTATTNTLVNLALICSAVTTGLNMFYNFFDYKDLWVHYKASRNELLEILSELEYLEASGLENISQKQLNDLFNRYKDICANTNKFYLQLRMQSDKTSDDQK